MPSCWQNQHDARIGRPVPRIRKVLFRLDHLADREDLSLLWGEGDMGKEKKNILVEESDYLYPKIF
jgi:hypothetical protein